MDEPLHVIDEDSDLDDELYMSLSQSVMATTHIDEHGRIALHPRMMRKLGVRPGTEVHVKVRLDETSMWFEDPHPPYLDRGVDVMANIRALGERVQATRAAREAEQESSDDA